MTFRRIDHRPGLGAGNPVWLICPLRNELAMLPDFMRHYRSIGIDHFCFIDNDSADGSREYLLAQSDCVVYHTDESYRHSNFAADWINRVVGEMRINGWLVVADIDEHLCYSGMENRPVQALLKGRELRNADCFHSAMVDMYPDGPFADLRISPGDRLLEIMPCFDEEYVFRRWPRPPWAAGPDGLQVLGGPRCRLLSALRAERRHGWLYYTAINQVDRFVEHVPLKAMPALAALWPREVPAQVKTPINFVREGFRFFNSHATTSRSPAPELVALLHFKFCAELQARMRMTSAEGNHYRRGLSYLQLKRAIRGWGPTLMYEGSRRCRGSADLDAVGLTGPRAAAVWQSGFREEFRTGPLP